MQNRVFRPCQVWLVTGASGLLGHALCEHLVARGKTVVGLRRRHGIDVAGLRQVEGDVCDTAAVARLVAEVSPDVVVHAAGLTDVDLCEQRPDLAEGLHVTATTAVAGAARACGARLVHVSTDHLWDGTKPMVAEDDAPCPVNAYGRTKLAGERAALAAHPGALVARTNFFGPGRPWRRSFSDWILDRLAAGETVRMFDDVHFTPIALAHLCPIVQEFVENGAAGLYHLAGGERLSKFEFGRRVALAFGYAEQAIERASVKGAALAAARPHDMSLATDKAAGFLGRPLPDANQGIATLVAAAYPEQSIKGIN